MITLEKPINLRSKLITTEEARRDIKLDKIDYVVSYDNSGKTATALIKPFMASVTLWVGDTYDSLGQFTDADVDARVKEIIGNDPQVFLQALIDKRFNLTRQLS